MMRYGTDAAQKGLTDDKFWRNHPMMFWGGNQSVGWIFGLLYLITWIAAIAVLVVFARWLWKKGDKVK